MKVNSLNKKGYKHTPLGWIPNEWEIKTLGDELDKIVGGGTPSRENGKYWGGNIYWATVKDLSSFNPNSTKEKITKQGLINSASNLIPEGTVITSTRMALGKVVIFNIEVAINQDLKAIFPNKKLDTKFLFYWFQLNSSKIEQLGNGSTVKGVTLEDLKRIPFIKCPLNEQKKITFFLATVDKNILIVEQIIAELKYRNKGLMQQLLSGKKRLKGYKTEWNEVRLKDIFERITRRNTEVNTNVLTISGQRGLINQEKYFSKQIASEILDNYYLLKKDEFAYNKSYSNGYPMGAIKRLNNYSKGVVTTLYICFKLKEKNYSLDFFEYLFEHGLLNKGLTKIAQEGGRAHGLLNVTSEDFFNLKIWIPQAKEQKAIASILQAAVNELKLYEQKLEILKEQKKGLMQKLLTGEVRVKV